MRISDWSSDVCSSDLRYGPPAGQDWGMEPSRDPAKVRLRDVLRPRRTIIDYLYDFGDGWEHRLTVTSVRQGEPGIGYPRYVAGERNAPPEDCGGIPGFYEQLEIGRASCRERVCQYV